MIYLYYYGNKLNKIVCGSSDKSETMMGYSTKWGDARRRHNANFRFVQNASPQTRTSFRNPREACSKTFHSQHSGQTKLPKTNSESNMKTLDLILVGPRTFL